MSVRRSTRRSRAEFEQPQPPPPPPPPLIPRAIANDNNNDDDDDYDIDEFDAMIMELDPDIELEDFPNDEDEDGTDAAEEEENEPSVAASAAAAAAAAAAAPSLDDLLSSPYFLSTASTTQQLKQYLRQIEVLQERVTDLAEKHRRRVLKASLLCDAASAWEQWDVVSAKERREKENILLALRSDVVPDCMRWERFELYFSKRLCSDREILLARLALDDFEQAFQQTPFPIPTRLKNDKEVALAVCSKNCHALANVSKTLRSDRDVVLAAITQKYCLAPLALKHAAMKLRGDRPIVTAALSRDYGIQAFKFVSTKLQKDRKLALLAIESSSEECSRNYEHLSELSPELRADEKVVMAAVKKRGSNLRFASTALLNDVDIVTAACRNDGRALQYCPEGPVRRRLLSARLLPMLISSGGASVLHHASEGSRMDGKLIKAAAAASATATAPPVGAATCTGATAPTPLDIPFSPQEVVSSSQELTSNSSVFLPETSIRTLLEDRKLAKEAVNLSVELYNCLPCEYKRGDSELGLVVFRSPSLNASTAASVLNFAPKLAASAEVMRIAAKKGYAEILSKDNSSWVRSDRGIMLEACKVDGSMLQIACDQFKRDPEIVRAALTSKVNASKVAFHVPKIVYQDHPDLAELAVRGLDVDRADELFSYIPQTVFHQERILIACLERQWKLGRYQFKTLVERGENQHNIDVILALVKRNWSYLDLACKCTLMDEDIVRAAIKVDGRVIRKSSLWKDNFDLTLLAVGTSRKTLQAFSHQGEDFDYLVQFAKEVRDRIRTADTFLLVFLRGISIVKPHVAPAKRCPLPMLDQGMETGIGYKRLVAEYIGVPMGHELSLLRAASDNLSFWGYD